ncbi:glutamate--tRNA ligase family protein, partial [Arcobacter sp.]
MLRFAPSPIGNMQLNSLRVALINYIVSKQLNEELLIRIEDIDKEKNIEGKDKEILELLSLFSIEYKTVIYQSENLKYHQKMAMQLMSQKKAFSCFCSDEKLEELRIEAKENDKPYYYDGFCETLSDETVLNCNAPFTVRIKKPESTISFTDLLKGDFSYEPFMVDSFRILKHDKTPTYDYACAVDDMLYDISTIIRTEEYLSNTAKQIHVRNTLNYTKNIDYIHLPKIINVKTGEALSTLDELYSV